MKTQILKSSMLALAGAVAIVAAGSASAAIAPPYLLCNYKGQTELSAAGSDTACWLNLTVKVGCDTDTDTLYIAAAGANAGDPSCGGLSLGNIPWVGSLAAIIGGAGVIDTTAGTGGSLPWSVIDASGPSPIAGGNVTGVSGIGGTVEMCNGQSITVPDAVQVSGTNNFGPMLGTFATFNTVAPDHLENRGCHVVM